MQVVQFRGKSQLFLSIHVGTNSSFRLNFLHIQLKIRRSSIDIYSSNDTGIQRDKSVVEKKQHTHTHARDKLGQRRVAYI